MISQALVFANKVIEHLAASEIQFIPPGTFSEMRDPDGLTVPVRVLPLDIKQISDFTWHKKYVVMFQPTTAMREQDGYFMLAAWCDAVFELLVDAKNVITMPPECPKWWIDDIQLLQTDDDRNQSIALQCVFNMHLRNQS